VTILGPINLPSAAAYHASQMYAMNVVSFVKNFVKKGAIVIDPDDEIIRETLVARDGRIVNPRIAALAPKEEGITIP
jgi:NAD(P) transhydrogenase subunit alpha